MKKKLLALLLLVLVVALVLAAGIFTSINQTQKKESSKLQKMKEAFLEDGSEESYNAVLAQYAEEKNPEAAIAFVETVSDKTLAFERLSEIYDSNSDSPIKAGNTMSNIQNGGTVALSGDAIFFVSEFDGGIYKRENGMNTRISDARATSLNAVEEWLYFVDLDEYRIYKMRGDGSELKKIGNFQTMQFYVIGNKMFFMNLDDERRIYSADISGKNLRKLSDRIPGQMTIYGSKIYFTDMSGEGEVYTVSLTGENETLLFDYAAHFIVGFEDGILFRNEDIREMVKEENIYLELCYRDADTGETFALYDSRIGFVSTSGDDIIFVDFDGGGSVLKMKSDKTGIEKITNDEADSLMVFGDMLYYYNENDNNKLYCISKDGKDRECLQ